MDISLNLLSQFDNAVEFGFVTQFLEKLDFHLLIIEIALKSNEVNLEKLCARVYGWAYSDICSPSDVRFLKVGIDCVNTVARQQLVGCSLDVRRGKAELAPQTLPLNDSPFQFEAASKKLGRSADITFLNLAPDQCAGYLIVPQNQRGNHIDPEAKLLAQSSQHLRSACSALAKSEVLPHNGVIGPNLLYDNVLDKLTRIHIGKSFCKWEHQHPVHPGCRKAHCAIPNGLDLRGDFARSQQIKGMPVKCDGDGVQSVDFANFDQPVQQQLMPTMHAIKRTYRNGGARSGRGVVFKSPENTQLGYRSFSRQLEIR